MNINDFKAIHELIEVKEEFTHEEAMTLKEYMWKLLKCYRLSVKEFSILSEEIALKPRVRSSYEYSEKNKRT